MALLWLTPIDPWIILCWVFSTWTKIDISIHMMAVLVLILGTAQWWAIGHLISLLFNQKPVKLNDKSA